jgi:hypothetical protein
MIITHYIDTYLMDEHLAKGETPAPLGEGIHHVITTDKNTVDCSDCIILMSDPKNQYNLEGAEHSRHLREIHLAIDQPPYEVSYLLVEDAYGTRRSAQYPKIVGLSMITEYLEAHGFRVIGETE